MEDLPEVLMAVVVADIAVFLMAQQLKAMP